jgi:hypothetical protein
MEAGILHRELSKLAGGHQITCPFGNGKALGIALGQAKTVLQEKFDFEILWDAHAKQNHYSFRPKQPELSPDKAVDDTPAAADPEGVPEFAGCAG